MGKPIYVTENLIDLASLCCASSEDPIYPMENLYCERPSKPFRFTGIGAPAAPEWICVTLASGQQVSFVGIFNHNLTAMITAGDELRLKGCDDGCPVSGAPSAGICDWDNPDYELDLQPRLVVNFNNLYRKLLKTYISWRLDIIDQANPDGYVEIGEFVLGERRAFSKDVHLQPGRADGPVFNMGNKRTFYGQDWAVYLSDQERLNLRFKNLNDPNTFDEFHHFLRTIQRNAGRFIIVPDEDHPLCYYVQVENLSDYSQLLVHGNQDLREQQIGLITLTKGIKLL